MKKSPVSQSNTLLNYFSRTPTSTPKSESPGDPKSSTPLRPNSNQNSTPKSRKTLQFTPKSAEKFKSPNTSTFRQTAYKLFDLVWAKLDGYPWWPAIICSDPETNSFQDPKGKFHVQFFDDPISHAWIKKRDIKPFSGAIQPGIPVKIKDKKLQAALDQAEEALNVEAEQRSKFIGDLNCGDYSRSVTESDDSAKISTLLKRKTGKENDSDSESEKISAKRKRFKRVSILDSESEKSEDEYVPETKEEEEESSDNESSMSGVESAEESFSPEEEEEKVAPKKGVKKTPKATKTNKKKANLSFSSKKSSITASNSVSDEQLYALLNNIQLDTSENPNESINQATCALEAENHEWPHLSYQFLQPATISDTYRCRMMVNGELNPQYDPATLYVPEDFLRQQTPAMRQWWEIKAKHFDTILFFKMGKFYELFHMDAVIATKELHILFMRGENAHAGFPEKSYKRYADVLIQKGYKVARIEQTETPAMMEERVKKMRGRPTKFDKVVKREVCRVSSFGTRFLSDIDSDVLFDTNTFLLSFTCKPTDGTRSEFGLCFVDVSIGKFFLTQFVDDHCYSKLRTLVSHYVPSEIILEKSCKLSRNLEILFETTRKQILKKFWPPTKTLTYAAEKRIWSEEFGKKILDDCDVLGQTSLPQYQLAVTALGGVIQYLEEAMIADDILSMNQFELYEPPEVNSLNTKLPQHLILDSLTIKNLDIFPKSKDEKNRSLFEIIDTCSTSFGRRLFRNWLCLPLCGQRAELTARQEAVNEINENIDLVSNISKWCGAMKRLPDLQRLLTQIHSQSLLKRANNHPDSRSIMFEGHIYRRRRINNFLNTLAGFEEIVALIDDLSTISSIESQYLRRIVCTEFPDLSSIIAFFRNSFDAEIVRKEGNIIPNKGVDQEYDDAMQTIDNVKQELDSYLKKQILFFKIKINYVNSNRIRYQLEIPESCALKAANCVEEKYELKSARKGFKRYHTTTISGLLNKLEDAESKREEALGDIFRRLLEKFDHDHDKWETAINCIAQFDALISLANTKHLFSSNDYSSCFPEFVWDQPESGPLIRVQDLRNALLIQSANLIPNDVELKGETLVLTGPNMAGKTTLMRSVGLLVVLAQMGAYVPASKCILSPVDRIFTRIGAYDQVIEAQSTFMVELNETVVVVNHATRNSLVLIDELGRGTSTFDGIAIASAVLDHLVKIIRCRTIFSTHYHSLVEELVDEDHVKLGYMSYMIENENKDHPTDEDVIFLYKLNQGICSKSFGFNVAKLAGIPGEIVRQSYEYGKEFERKVESSRLLGAYIESRKESKPFPEDKLNTLCQYLYEMVLIERGQPSV